MRKYIFILSLALLAQTGRLAAQEKKWTLGDCIAYAVSNNLNLQRQKLQTEVAQSNLTKSKLDLLPNLNFGADANMGFGRSVNPVTNLITFKQNFSNSYSLSSSLNIFNGFTTLNTLSANKFMMAAGLEKEKVTRNTLIIDIMGQYYQVMYTRGLEKASQLRLELSQNQLFRITKMVETGRESLSKQFEMESQVSADGLNYTVAQNASSQALTTLRQMLQIEPDVQFDINMPDLENVLITDESFDTDSIYQIAAATLPRLRAIEYELRATEKQVGAAKGYISPRLTAGGAIFTGYYKVMSESDVEQMSFQDQLKNNNSQAVYLSLDIPLFNNYTTGRNIKQAKLRRDDAALRLQLEKNNLYTEIENACLNYNRGKDEYKASKANLDFNRKSFSVVEKKFESGLVNVTEFATAKTTLFDAETEALRTRLQLLIRRLMINFYTTGEYEQILITQ